MGNGTAKDFPIKHIWKIHIMDKFGKTGCFFHIAKAPVALADN
jgi:hypothetical protein